VCFVNSASIANQRLFFSVFRFGNPTNFLSSSWIDWLIVSFTKSFSPTIKLSHLKFFRLQIFFSSPWSQFTYIVKDQAHCVAVATKKEQKRTRIAYDGATNLCNASFYSHSIYFCCCLFNRELVTSSNLWLASLY